jgi:hypothetical protein
MRSCLSVLLIWLASCSGGMKPDGALTMDSRFLPDTSKQRLLKIIEGGWVNEAYIDAFGRYNSPMAAASHGLPQQQMAFDISRLEGDTLINVHGRLNYNESQRFDVVFYRKKNGAVGMMIDENRNYIAATLLLDYTIEDKDTILLLTIPDEKAAGTYRFRRTFRRFPESDDVPLTAMELFANTKLFAGNWKMGNETISFEPTGRVNFHEYKRYAVTTVEEYTSSRPDEITFYNDTSGVTYAFTSNHGKVQLYEVEESNDGMTITRGKMVGELERI